MLNIQDFIQKGIDDIKTMAADKKVICATSGGVDSTVAAVLAHKAIGDNLVCIFVDHGLLRKNEVEEVCDMYVNQFDINLIAIDARTRFLNKLEGVVDPEQKRKIIGHEFINVFTEEAAKVSDADFLLQGTIYPDILESGSGSASAIKSHHNVGGMPEDINFKGLIEPLKSLYKNQVRDVGLALNIPKQFVFRQPFPGPGLAVRVIGEITEQKLDILREADYIFRSELPVGYADQYFAILTNIKSVGVTDHDRTYDYTIALRAVKSSDFMTADFCEIPYSVLRAVSSRIVNEIKGVNRVVYDITTKPPATIEWE